MSIILTKGRWGLTVKVVDPQTGEIWETQVFVAPFVDQHLDRCYHNRTRALCSEWIMTNLFIARLQMAFTLAFHIIFAVAGIGMPLLMVIAEGIYLRTKKPVLLELTKSWSKVVAVLFAVGAVSGTVISFELGLLWPKFMEFSGGIIGLAFSLEGFAFFVEAIFLGVYLYGWNRISPLAHWISGLMVALGGAMSGVIVLTTNAWMNSPSGFDLLNGKPIHIDPVAAIFNQASFHEILHMMLSAYVTAGFAIAAIHAWYLLKDRTHPTHRAALSISLLVGIVSIPLLIFSGDISSRRVAELQPAKLAAMEALYETRSSAPLVIGGIPDDKTMSVKYGIKIPYGLSILAARDPKATITGLYDIPRDEWPNTALVHLAFDLMVGSGFAILAVAAWACWLWWKRRELPDTTWFLRALLVAGPMSVIALEAGWVVTELGRQPWIIYKIMRTADAVTTMPGLIYTFITYLLLYLILFSVVVVVLRQHLSKFGEGFDDPS